jgi:diaminopropionate ammonia-lyase
MTGLRNREVSPLAFNALLPNVDAFLAIDDRWAFDAMRSLNRVGIRAGASGAATLGGLLALCQDAAMIETRRALALDASANVLVLVSEGVTAPELWASVVGGR